MRAGGSGRGEPIFAALTRPPETLLLVLGSTRDGDEGIIGVLDTHTRFVGSKQYPASFYQVSRVGKLGSRFCDDAMVMRAASCDAHVCARGRRCMCWQMPACKHVFCRTIPAARAAHAHAHAALIVRAPLSWQCKSLAQLADLVRLSPRERPCKLVSRHLLARTLPHAMCPAHVHARMALLTRCGCASFASPSSRFPRACTPRSSAPTSSSSSMSSSERKRRARRLACRLRRAPLRQPPRPYRRLVWAVRRHRW